MQCIAFYPDNIDAERSLIQSILYCAEVVSKNCAVRPESAIYTRAQGAYASVQRPQWMYLSIKLSAYVIVTDSTKLLLPNDPNSHFLTSSNYKASATPFQLPQLGAGIRH
jgi:hypothetical protein